MAHREQPIPSLTALRQDVPPPLDAVFRKMVAKLPDERYQNMGQVIDALQSCLAAGHAVTGSAAVDDANLRKFLMDLETADTPTLIQSELSGNSAARRETLLPRASASTEPISEKPRPGASPPRRSRQQVTRPGRPDRVSIISGILLGLLAIGVSLWASGILVKVETPHGTLVVNVTGDNFATTVKGQVVTLRNTQTDETVTVTLDAPQTRQPDLKASDYEFQVATGSGLKTRTNRFQIDGQTDAVVEVWWEPAEALARSTVQPSTPSDTRVYQMPLSPVVDSPSRDLEVAEWVIAQEGYVGVNVSGVFVGSIHELSQLPQGDVSLTVVNLADSMSVTNSDVERLIGLPIDWLGLRGTTVDRGVLPLLARCMALQSLDVSGTRITTADLPELDQVRLLRELQFASHQIDDHWAFLERLKGVRTISTYDSQLPPDLDNLKRYPQLRELRFHGLGIADAKPAASIQDANPHLRIVAGYGRGARVVGEDPVRRAAESLVALGARLTGIDPQGDSWSSENGLPSGDGAFVVQVVELPGLSANRVLVEQLGTWFSSLSSVHVTIVGARGADEILTTLAKSGGVVSCGLRDSDLTDLGLKSLTGNQVVSHINVCGTQVTRAAVEGFCRQHPECWVMSDYGEFRAWHRAPQDPDTSSSSTTDSSPGADQASSIWPADAPQ